MSGARDQLGRLLAMVPYLQGREVPVDQVARDFGVTPKRVINDLWVLCMCGLPGLLPGDLIEIDFDALEPDGDQVVRLSNAEFLPRPLRLDTVEAAALVVALRTLRESSDDATRDVVERALAKIEGAAGSGAEVGHVVDVPTAVETAPVRAVLEDALRRRRQVHLDYVVAARDEATSRRVDPIALLSHDGHDYLDAWCHRAEARRLFRLDRVLAATVQDSLVQKHDLRPRDLAAGLFEPGPDAVRAVVQVTPMARWVAEYYPVQATRELPDGGLELTLLVGDPAWLTRLVARLAPNLTVVSPLDLIEATRQSASVALSNYQ